MSRCPNCGFETDGKFCPQCGSSMPQPVEVSEPAYNSAQPNSYQTYNAANNYNTASQPTAIPAKYKPISAWGYVGYSLLFAIPIAGFIVAIVFACSDENINRRNYARSIFCALLLSLIIAAVVAIIAIATGVSLNYHFGRLYY